MWRVQPRMCGMQTVMIHTQNTPLQYWRCKHINCSCWRTGDESGALVNRKTWNFFETKCFWIPKKFPCCDSVSELGNELRHKRTDETLFQPYLAMSHASFWSLVHFSNLFIPTKSNDWRASNAAFAFFLAALDSASMSSGSGRSLATFRFLEHDTDIAGTYGRRERRRAHVSCSCTVLIRRVRNRLSYYRTPV